MIKSSIRLTKFVLTDARFISIIELIKANDRVKALYLVRLVTGWDTMPSKRYIDKIEKFKKKMRNPLQY